MTTMTTEPNDTSDADQLSCLRRNNQEYLGILEDSPMYFSSFLPDGTLTFVNTLLASKTGKTPDELVGKSFFTMLPPDEQLRVRECLNTLSPAHPVETHEQLYVSPDGTAQWQQWTNRAFFDENGVVTRYQAIGLDITARKQAEDKVRHLSSFPELSPNPVVEINSSGKITYCNPRALKILNDMGKDETDIHLLLPGDLRAILSRWDGHTKTVYNREVMVGQRMLAESILLIPGVGAARVYAHEITKGKRIERQFKSSIKNYRIFANLTSDYVHRCSRTGTEPFRVQWIGGSVSTISGYSTREIYDLGCFLPIIHPDDREAVASRLLKLVPGDVKLMEFRMQTKEGDIRWIAEKCRCERGEADGELLLFGSVRDITERKQMEETLRLAHAELQRHDTRMVILNQMNDLLLSCESREEAYTVISTTAQKLFSPYSGGLAISQRDSPEMLVVASWGDASGMTPRFPASDCWALRRRTPHKINQSAEYLGCKLYQGSTEHPHFCLPLLAGDQTLGLLQVMADSDSVTAQFDEMYNLAMTMSESITLALSNLMLREALREQTIRDPLTGLFNRRYLEETLPLELKTRQRNNESLTVAMLDLDHFKSFNDSYGHEAGDIVLREIGALLRRSLRGGDIACRYGGEEFTVILPGSTLDHAVSRLDSLRHRISDLRLQNRDLLLPAITVSIGMSEAKPQETDAATLLGRADAALYRAKQQGRNRVVTESRE